MTKYICEQCGKEFTRRGEVPGRYCSLDCKAEWQRTQKPVDKKWLEQKYLVKKLSTYEIAKLVKRDPKSVYRWLVGYGIPTRPRGLNLKGKDNYMKQPGAVNPFQGKRHTEKTKKILSAKASIPKPWLRGENNGMYGKTGDSNPNYVDGSSPERQKVYASSEWQALLRKVFKRDKYRCIRCGDGNRGKRRLHVHHIKPWAGNADLRFDLSNTITLCRSCHEWVHSSANTKSEYLDLT